MKSPRVGCPECFVQELQSHMVGEGNKAEGLPGSHSERGGHRAEDWYTAWVFSQSNREP